MKQPLISVILPVYNVEAYLESCVESLLAQTYENLELLIVDDGSGSVCAELCDALKNRDARIVVFHKPNGGISDARNFGVELARGEYLTFVDPDDRVDEDYVSYLFGLIGQYGTRMSVCQHWVHQPNGHVDALGGEGSDLLDAKTCIRRMLYHDGIDTSVWGKLYRRDLFDGVRYPVGKLFEDMGVTYQLFLRSGEIAVGWEMKYHYLIRANSIVTAQFNPHKLDLLEMTDRMAAEVTALWPDLAPAALRRQVYARFSTLNQTIGAEGELHREEMIRFIRAHQSDVLRDPDAPRRDKLAIRALSMGFGAYQAFWKTYLHLKKGESA